MGIFTIPVQIAVKFKIPLIIWGENSQAEYGGPLEDQERNFQDVDWHKKYGETIYVKNQTSGYRNIEHMLEYGVEMRNLLPYVYPSDEEILKVGVTGLYLGQFLKWDGIKQLQKMKQKYGFMVHDGPMEGTYTNYENLENKGQGLHDYMKWVKFGYGRATDQASIEIRHRTLERKEGLRLVKKYEGKIPEIYLEEYLKDFEITREEFFKIVDKIVDTLAIIISFFLAILFESLYHTNILIPFNNDSFNPIALIISLFIFLITISYIERYFFYRASRYIVLVKNVLLICLISFPTNVAGNTSTDVLIVSRSPIMTFPLLSQT